jgi:negative regulator of replication initiation
MAVAARKYKNVAMKQRSFYMDDETYALIERHAERLGTSNGTALRMLVRHELLDETPAPAQRDGHPMAAPLEQRAPSATASQIAEGVNAHAAIILPPDTQETFRVPEKFREKGPRVPRPKHDDDDF